MGRVGGGEAAIPKKPGGARASVTPSKLNHTSFSSVRTSENCNGARNKGNAQSPTSNRRVTVCGAVGRVDGARGGGGGAEGGRREGERGPTADRGAGSSRAGGRGGTGGERDRRREGVRGEGAGRSAAQGGLGRG